jgi:hypothetical protein
VTRDVARNQHGAELATDEGGYLLVLGADACPLLIGQHGTIHRARHVILGKFRGRADVDDLVKLGQLRYGRNILGCRQ